MPKRLSTVLLAVLSALAACHRQPEAPEKKMRLTVTSPQRTDTELSQSYVAQIRAIQHIEVRAIERGYLQGIFVDEGQHVARGQNLFQIWPAIYDAELQKAAASAQVADIEYSNTKALADKNVVSTKELAISRARANEAKAEVNLATTRKGMTDFKAPFDGLVGRFMVRKGSLVDKGDLLTTLSDVSSLWVYFNVSEPEYLEYRRKAQSGALPEVRLMMANGRLYDQVGHVETIESDFDNATGTIAFRALFPNKEALLRHGETGKIVLKHTLKGALIIPQKATFDVLEKKYVFKVGADGALVSQVIQVAAEMPQVFVVASGLSEGDKILVDGLRRVTDGTVIEPDYHPPTELLPKLEVPAE